MKLYYYIHTGHRFGLDRLRRGAALYKQLKLHGIEANVLLNDFRATIVAKELGIESSTAIDSMYNIASMAQAGDGLIIDTPELSDEVLQQMCSIFRVVVNFSNEKPKFGEKVISQTFEDENSVQMLPIDTKYFQKTQKEAKTLLFYGDEDYEKNLIQQTDKFQNMDLLIGHYFFLEYEKQLESGFDRIVEDYDTITQYENVVSRSLQTALEAAASGAKVCYIGEELLSLVTLRKDLQIPTADPLKESIDGGCINNIDIIKLEKLSIKLNYPIILAKLDLSQFKFN
ncbi:MAG: hypothetical protein ACQESH_00885 [Campylobacterota bacterium]